MIPGNSFISRSKYQRSRSRGTKRRRPTDGTQYCRLLRALATLGFSPLQSPLCTSHASDTGFSLCHFPAADAAVDRQFFRPFFRSQPAAKT